MRPPYPAHSMVSAGSTTPRTSPGGFSSLLKWVSSVSVDSSCSDLFFFLAELRVLPVLRGDEEGVRAASVISGWMYSSTIPYVHENFTHEERISG